MTKQEKILELLQTVPLTASQISVKLNMSKQYVFQLAGKMVKKGLLVKHGDRKGVMFVVKGSNGATVKVLSQSTLDKMKAKKTELVLQMMAAGFNKYDSEEEMENFINIRNKVKTIRKKIEEAC